MAWCFLYRSVYTCLSAVQVNFAGKIKKKTHAALSSCAQREHRRPRGYTWCTLEISFYISLLHYVIWIDIWIWQWLNVFHVPFFVLVEMRNGDKMYVLPSIFDNYSHKDIHNSKKVCEVIANFSCNLCWWKKKQFRQTVISTNKTPSKICKITTTATLHRYMHLASMFYLLIKLWFVLANISHE